MNVAVKQFGPNGLTPDKLLMFTNFATADFAIVGILTAPQEVSWPPKMRQLAKVRGLARKAMPIASKCVNLVIFASYRSLNQTLLRREYVDASRLGGLSRALTSRRSCRIGFFRQIQQTAQRVAAAR